MRRSRRIHADPSRLLAGAPTAASGCSWRRRRWRHARSPGCPHERGAYTPIAAGGSRAGCVFAVARGRAVTCVPRLVAALTPDGSAPLGRGLGQHRIAINKAQPLDVFTGAVLQPTATGGSFTLDAAAIFEPFPSLLIPADGPALPPFLPVPPSCLAMRYFKVIWDGHRLEGQIRLNFAS
jgi:hypothetical protein